MKKKTLHKSNSEDCCYGRYMFQVIGDSIIEVWYRYCHLGESEVKEAKLKIKKRKIGTMHKAFNHKKDIGRLK